MGFLNELLTDVNMDRIARQIRYRAKDYVRSDPSFDKLLLFVGVLYLGNRLINTAIRTRNTVEETRRRARSVYDRRAGHTVTAKRDLTVDEWVEFDRRYARGEAASDIFRSMGLR